jgi:peptidoglycan/xylan/chitin deacetylase (PgdA/CDA1 family)
MGKLMIHAAAGIHMLSRYAMKLTGGQRTVWLTFDDGPHPLHTKRILDTLKQRRIPATFFMTGQSVKRYPDVVRRAVAEGHIIGNHGYTHTRLNTLDRNTIRQEIEGTADVLAHLIHCIAGIR